MKPDYKNWMPKGMVLSALLAAAVLLILALVFGRNLRCRPWHSMTNNKTQKQQA